MKHADLTTVVIEQPGALSKEKAAALARFLVKFYEDHKEEVDRRIAENRRKAAEA